MARLQRHLRQLPLGEQHRPDPFGANALAAELVPRRVERGKGIRRRLVRGEGGRVSKKPEAVLNLPVDAGNRRVLGLRLRNRSNGGQRRHGGSLQKVICEAFHAPSMTGKLWRADGRGCAEQQEQQCPGATAVHLERLKLLQHFGIEHLYPII